MATVTTKTFTQLVQGIAAAVQARASGLVDFSVGAIERAASEAFSAVCLWLQAQVLQLLTATRAQTCVGSDLDDWIADWAAGPTSSDPTLISRFQAVGSTGSVTFSRLSTTTQVVVPIGASVETLDGTQQYEVTVDASNPAYSAALGGYVMAVGTAAVTVPVSALATGSATNAVAGAIDTITSAIPGVDSVTNAAGFTNGADAETDAEYLARFRTLIRGLSKGTPAAIASAIEALQRGVQCVPVENLNYDGTSHAGFFYFVVDDGTGAPSSTLLNAAGSAVDATRAAGIEFGVYGPVVVDIAVTATLGYVSGLDSATQAATKAVVISALQTYLDTLPLDTLAVPLSRIDQVMHDASPNVQKVTGLELNGVAADVALTVQQVAKAGTMTISP